MVAELLAAAGVLVGTWQSGPPLPVARTEVAGAVVRGEIYIVGGYLADGRSSPRVDIYSPQTRRWRRLAPMPAPRAAAGTAVAAGRLYVVGGVRQSGVLAQVAFAFNLRRLRWTTVPGPTPREHLAAAALGGKVYTVAGRLSGLKSNQTLVESLTPGARRWNAIPSLPEARGGTGAAAADGRLVSVGGEEPAGTIASVYAYDPPTRRWQQLPDLPTPRHAVVGIGPRVYVIAGGPRPGLYVSGANESLDVRD